jgi:WD40 repeat protein
LHTLQDRKKVVAGIANSADGQLIATVSYGGRFMIWTIEGEPVVGVNATKKNLNSAAFSPDGTYLAVSGLGDDITLWSLPTGEQIGTLKGHKIAVWNLQFINNGRTMVSFGYEQSIKFWDSESWQAIRTLPTHSTSARGLMFSPDEKTAAVSMENKVQLWSVDDWQLQAELPISTKVISAMAYSPDGKLIAIGGADKKVRIFDNPV